MENTFLIYAISHNQEDRTERVIEKQLKIQAKSVTEALVKAEESDVRCDVFECMGIAA